MADRGWQRVVVTTSRLGEVFEPGTIRVCSFVSAADSSRGSVSPTGRSSSRTAQPVDHANAWLPGSGNWMQRDDSACSRRPSTQMGTRCLRTARQAVDKGSCSTKRNPHPSRGWVEVNAAGVRVENCRQFGGPWLALELIRRLQLDAFLQRELASGQEHVPWSLMRFDPRDCPTPGAVQRTAHSGTVVSQDSRCQNYWACRSSVSTTIGCTARWMSCYHSRRLCRFISSSGWEACSHWTTTSCCMTSPARSSKARLIFRWPSGVTSRDQPQRLKAGLHWIGGVALWDAAGLRSVSGKHGRRQYRRKNRGTHGATLREIQPYLGHGPGHGQREEPDLLASGGTAIPGGHAQRSSQKVRTGIAGRRLAQNPRRDRGQAAEGATRGGGGTRDRRGHR